MKNWDKFQTILLSQDLSQMISNFSEIIPNIRKLLFVIQLNIWSKTSNEVKQNYWDIYQENDWIKYNIDIYQIIFKS